MIGFIAGNVIHREDTQLTVLSQGVGYEINCTLNALSLGNASDAIELWTHLIVREDVQQLYGFGDKTERTLFRELIRISGIGPKVALAILSGMDSPGLVSAIQKNDSQTLTKIPGIGKKTAERLVVEMKDRLDGMTSSLALGDIASVNEQHRGDGLEEQAESALIALGYKPAEAARMISAIDAPACVTVEALIREALRSKLA